MTLYRTSACSVRTFHFTLNISIPLLTKALGQLNRESLGRVKHIFPTRVNSLGQSWFTVSENKITEVALSTFSNDYAFFSMPYFHFLIK